MESQMLSLLSHDGANAVLAGGMVFLFWRMRVVEKALCNGLVSELKKVGDAVIRLETICAERARVEKNNG